MIRTAVTAAKAVTALYGPPSNFGLNVHSCQSLTDFYRTHVHMGSDHWVAVSVRHSKTFVT